MKIITTLLIAFISSVSASAESRPSFGNCVIERTSESVKIYETDGNSSYAGTGISETGIRIAVARLFAKAQVTVKVPASSGHEGPYKSALVQISNGGTTLITVDAGDDQINCSLDLLCGCWWP